MIHIRSFPPLEESHVKKRKNQRQKHDHGILTKEVAYTIMTLAVRPRFLTRTGLFLWGELYETF